MDLDYASSRLGILKFLQIVSSLFIFFLLCIGGYFVHFDVVAQYFKFDFIALASAACFFYGSITYGLHLFGWLKFHRWVLYDEDEPKFARQDMWLSACFSLIFWISMFIIFATTSDVDQRKALPNATLYFIAGIASGLLAMTAGVYAFHIGAKVYPRLQTSEHSNLDQGSVVVLISAAGSAS
ncbi:hypothetical protein Ddc_16464 [Ditylenchus destructor]|nr:hypothetical protein Ddc_16464 [Ditylenchus destructor]